QELVHDQAPADRAQRGVVAGEPGVLVDGGHGAGRGVEGEFVHDARSTGCHRVRVKLRLASGSMSGNASGIGARRSAMAGLAAGLVLAAASGAAPVAGPRASAEAAPGVAPGAASDAAPGAASDAAARAVPGPASWAGELAGVSAMWRVEPRGARGQCILIA